MKNIFIIVVLIITVTIVFLSCSSYQSVVDFFKKPTPREIYSRNFTDKDTLFNQWRSVFELAKKDSIPIDIPYTEKNSIISTRTSARSYFVKNEEGSIFVLKLDEIDTITSFFVDIYDISIDPNLTNKPKLTRLITSFSNSEIRINESGIFKIIIQSKMKISSSFTIRMYMEPKYRFPVVGKTNTSIQSFWGASRDNGKRGHEGIDIFADRGTPVIAVTNGYITATRNEGLGGKQVWLRDGLWGASLYYAHLDSIAVAIGNKVRTGDTLGFVGNTGNARTTVPHLHFGMYKNTGAINPLFYIKITEKPETTFNYSQPNMPYILSGSNARLGPDVKFKTIFTTDHKMDIEVLGKTKKWYRILLPDSTQAFVHESLIKERK